MSKLVYYSQYSKNAVSCYGAYKLRGSGYGIPGHVRYFQNIRSSIHRRCESCMTGRGLILNTINDDCHCVSFVIISQFFTALKIINKFRRLFVFFSFFVSSLPLRQESVSNDALPCYFPYSKNNLSLLKRCNR